MRSSQPWCSSITSPDFGVQVAGKLWRGWTSIGPAGDHLSMTGKYELKKSSDGQFVFNLKAGNGEVILTSERYKAKESALKGIESVRKNSPDDARYDRLASTAREPYFVLKAANGEVIGRSEMYSSASAMENGIRSVKENGPSSPLVDNA